MNKQFEYEIPNKLKGIILSDGFYVTINQNYTATVRDLPSFIWAINNCEPDESFGVVKSESSDKNSKEFFIQMMLIINTFKGFALFNRGMAHQFIQCENENETISIKTKSGKRITVSVIEMSDSVDIVYHDSTLENADKNVPQFEVIGFNCGQTPIKRTAITVATIKLK